jgi:stage 0 sporulation regulatory protein
MNLYLKKQIEQLRKHMIQTGLQQGLTSPRAIKLSQELDKLLNFYDQNKQIR